MGGDAVPAEVNLRAGGQELFGGVLGPRGGGHEQEQGDGVPAAHRRTPSGSKMMET